MVASMQIGCLRNRGGVVDGALDSLWKRRKNRSAGSSVESGDASSSRKSIADKG